MFLLACGVESLTLIYRPTNFMQGKSHFNFFNNTALQFTSIFSKKTPITLFLNK